jgi:hypothetical protein
MGAALLTKGTGILAVVALPATLLCFDWRPDGRAARMRGWAASTAVSLAVAGACYLLLVVSPQYQRLAEERPESLRSLHDGLAHPQQWWNIGWPNTWRALEEYFTKPLLVLAAVGLALALLARRARIAVLIAGWIGVSVVVTVLLAKTPYPRYLAVAVAFLAVLAGCGIAGAVALARAFAGGRRWAAPMAAIALAATFVPAVRFDARMIDHPGTFRYPAIDYEQYVTGGYSGTGWKEVADRIERETGGRPTKVVVAGVFSWALPLLMDGRDSITVADLSGNVGPNHSAFAGLDAADPDAALRGAGFLVANGPEPPAAIRSRLTPLLTYRRPVNGPPVPLRLYRVAP